MLFAHFLISFIVPAPEVTVTRSQVDNTLLAGSQLTIYCNITVDMNVDTPFTVDTTWTRTDSYDNDTIIDSISGRVTVYSPYSTGVNRYQSRVEFNTLSSIEDPGEYTCEVAINSNSTYTFIFDSHSYNNSTTELIVNRELHYFPNTRLVINTLSFQSLLLQ